MKASPHQTSPDATKTKKWRRVGECLYVYQPSGTYYARARVRGKLKTCSLKTKDRALANRRLRDWRNDQAKMDPNAGDMTLEGLAERFQAILKGAKNTVSDKRRAMRHLLERWPKDAPRRISRIRQGHIKAWLATLDIGASGHNSHLWAVREMFQQAVADHLLPENPASGIPPAKRPKPVRLTPSWEQFKAIIASVRQQHSDHADDSGDLLEFMGRAGVGQAEAAKLRWKHFDFTRDAMHLFRVKTSTAYPVAMFPQVRPLLERIRDKVSARPDPEAPVFKIKSPKIALENACERLGFAHFTPRSLRRMFITRCIELGVPIKTIAGWQGHQDGGVLILSVYSHVIEAHANREAAKLVTDDEEPADVVAFTPDAAG